MQINCIFNHNQNKEIIPKSGIFFQKSISNLLLSWKKKIKYREKSIYYQMPFRLTPFSAPSGKNENLLIMRNVLSFLLNFIFSFIFADGWNGHMKELQVDGDQLQINVEELQPVTEYSFRLLAENAVGRSLPSIPLTLVTESEGMA